MHSSHHDHQGFDQRPNPVTHNHLPGSLLCAMVQPRETDAQWALNKLYQSATSSQREPFQIRLDGTDFQKQYGRLDLPDLPASLIWFEDNSCLVARRDGDVLQVHPVVLKFTAPDSEHIDPWALKLDDKPYPEAVRQIPLFLHSRRSGSQWVDPIAALKGQIENPQACQVAHILAEEIRSWAEVAHNAPALLAPAAGQPRRGVHPEFGPYDWPNAIPFVGWSDEDAEKVRVFLEKIVGYLFVRHAKYCNRISAWIRSEWAEQGSLQSGAIEMDATWRDPEFGRDADFSLYLTVHSEICALLASDLCPVPLSAFVVQSTSNPTLSDYRNTASHTKITNVASAYCDDECSATMSHHQKLQEASRYNPVLKTHSAPVV